MVLLQSPAQSNIQQPWHGRSIDSSSPASITSLENAPPIPGSAKRNMEKAKTDESKLWEVAVKYMQKLTDNPVERKNSRRSLLQHDRKIFECHG